MPKRMLLLALPLLAQPPLEEMHLGIRTYLEGLPVLQRKLPAHPNLLEADRCESATAQDTLVVLTYRKLDCAKYPGQRVVAPRLIHPELRERVRRMGFAFGQVPLGFELAAYDAVRGPVRMEPAMSSLFGPVAQPRPQENAFAISIRPHEESRVERSTRDVSRIEEYLKGLIPQAEATRQNLLQTQGASIVGRRWHDEVAGALPVYSGALKLRQLTVYRGEKWTGTAITLEALPGVIAHGVLLRPQGMRPGERRPLVIVQHGLMGSPQSYFLQATDSKEYATYRNFAERLIDEGFVVFCPQNPYAGDFRPLQLLANPRGMSLMAFVEAQYRRSLDYLETLDFIDPVRISFYGLSYGGYTALRVPVFDARFKAIVCGGNFNEWIRKLSSPALSYGYVHTKEYEVYEWNMANVASHAELAALGMLLHPRPIPFLVERGHQDPVGEDEWVEFEFRRLQRYVPREGLAKLAFFDGNHRTDGVAAIPFLKGSNGH